MGFLAGLAYSNKTASGAVKSAPGIFCGAVLTGGSDAATLIVYDNTAGSGTVVLKLAAAAGVSVSIVLPEGVACNKGMYAALTGTAPSASVFYG